MRQTTEPVFLIILTIFISVNFACKNEVKPEMQTYEAFGIVQSIDAETGKITIDHENIPGYMSPDGNDSAGSR